MVDVTLRTYYILRKTYQSYVLLYLGYILLFCIIRKLKYYETVKIHFKPRGVVRYAHIGYYIRDRY